MKKQQGLADELALLDSVELARFIVSLYGEDDFLDAKIERLLLKKDISELVKSLKKEIKSLGRSTYFYSYYQAGELAEEIYQLQMDIENTVLPGSPDLAFKLADDLLDTAENSLNRCDDSDGSVGDVYRDTCLLWLKTASLSAVPATGWVPVIKKLADNNDYGVLDLLLPNANQLLSEDELRQLADYYERGLVASLKKKKGDIESINWSVNLHSIAEALKDPALYIRATLLGSPEPNSLQMESMVQFSLNCGAYDEALNWLQKDWGEHGWSKPDARRLSLLAECYLGLNQPEKHLSTLIELMDASPTFENFQRVQPLVSEEGARELREKLIVLVSNETELYDQLDPLLKLGENSKAEKIAIERAVEFSEWHYIQLVSLLGKVPEENRLFRIILLRTLTDDILERGRTQAYHHGARYLQQLDQLDKNIDAYSSLQNHVEYMAKVKAKHGRKYSFWAQYNKAS